MPKLTSSVTIITTTAEYKCSAVFDEKHLIKLKASKIKDETDEVENLILEVYTAFLSGMIMHVSTMCNVSVRDVESVKKNKLAGKLIDKLKDLAEDDYETLVLSIMTIGPKIANYPDVISVTYS